MAEVVGTAGTAADLFVPQICSGFSHFPISKFPVLLSLFCLLCEKWVCEQREMEPRPGPPAASHLQGPRGHVLGAAARAVRPHSALNLG